MCVATSNFESQYLRVPAASKLGASLGFLLCCFAHGEECAQAKGQVGSHVPALIVAFTCNGNPVEQVPSIKYLGLHFHSVGCHFTCDPVKAKAGSSLGDYSTAPLLTPVWPGHYYICVCCVLVWGMHIRMLLLLTVLVWHCNDCTITVSATICDLCPLTLTRRRWPNWVYYS